MARKKDPNEYFRLQSMETGPFILCVIENLELKQVFGGIFIHRLFYILTRLYLITDLDLQFKKQTIGFKSDKLDQYIVSLLSRYFLAKLNIENYPKSAPPIYFVTHTGIEHYKNHLAKYKQKLTVKIAERMNYYNALSPEELYHEYKKFE